MERQAEPELMSEEEQARAYALADFEAPHEYFVELFKQRFADDIIDGEVLDLGCGPADVIIRFARHYPDCHILGIDGSEAMLKYGQQAIDEAQLGKRITLQKAYLPEEKMPHRDYQAIISNSLLHHLDDPQTLWKVIRSCAQTGTRIFVMDLMRPRSESAARDLMEEYAGSEPEILKRDFYNSLLAAYTVSEVEEQLEREVLLEFSVKPVSDRHLIVTGVW